MKFIYNIGRTAAIRNGCNLHGKQEIDIDVSKLTSEQREELARQTEHDSSGTIRGYAVDDRGDVVRSSGSGRLVC